MRLLALLAVVCPLASAVQTQFQKSRAQAGNDGSGDIIDQDGNSPIIGQNDLDDLASNLTGLANTTSTVLIQLIDALKAGTVEENGLDEVLSHAAANNTAANGTNPKTATTCPAMAVIFARGTIEPGNVGFLAGPPFFQALQTYMNGTNGIVLQGIDYPATTSGFFLGGDPRAGAQMALLTNATMALCPRTKVVLSGYSQGAQVVHLAAQALPANTTAALSSVVLFGDPKNGTAVQGVDPARTLVVCHAGDNICQGGNLVLGAHLNYSLDAASAAMFVMQKSGLGLASNDAMMQGMGNTLVGKAMKSLGIMN